MVWFSSPFIEERLYLKWRWNLMNQEILVLVPFYRGAVVFKKVQGLAIGVVGFSSPFIEERLYLINKC